ncbi:MAG: UDP-N-acetylglucosamine 1-carboxyvinyltransferase [Nitrospinae bacterium]|nr:UDP-N-acetylglucosamine 1-carboxyvinyltransferase [Nitrospinota bacterium]
MERFRIRGGRPLRGEAEASGSKNASLPILAAAILAGGVSHAWRVPDLRDTNTILGLLGEFGVKTREESPGRISLDATNITGGVAPYELVQAMRASILVLGPLLARFGSARVSLPGGCAIGARPIDQHLKGLSAMGAEIQIEQGYIEARSRKLTGARISFDLTTVTGTKNLMMAATLAKGVTVLENAALEPEVVALADLLNRMGARVSGAGTPVVEIEGVDSLAGYDAAVPADRIEVGTLMIAAAITGGDLRITDCEPEQVHALALKLSEAGLEVSEGADWIRVRGDGSVRPVNVKTAPYPGFPTDLQAQFMALMTLAGGTCVLTETIFENRFMHAAELARMNARIHIDGRTAHIEGVAHLAGASVTATDLRASASLVLAGLAADGETIVRNVYHIDRGYQRLEERLRELGADIRREVES